MSRAVREFVARNGTQAGAGAFCFGLAVANAVRIDSPAVAFVAVVLACSAALRNGPARTLLVAGALACAGLWWASARLDALDRSVLASMAGDTERALVVVTGPARRGVFEQRVPARVVRFGKRAVRESALLELPLGRSPPQGGLLAVTTTVELPRGPERGFNERTWLRRHGMHVVLKGGNWRIVGKRGGVGGIADAVHVWLAQRVAQRAHGERHAVIAGIVLGEDEGLSDELRDDFRASGLYHLLAVSGQNVALVAGGVFLLGWLLGVSRVVIELGALAAIGAYLLAVGWQPSVVRAGVAGALASLAWVAGRQRDRWHFLLVGAAVLLAWNPYSLLDPGFQLSFIAVTAIFLGARPVERLLEGYPVPTPLARVIGVSFVCGVATAPVLWLQFSRVPLYSVPANALAAPAVAPLLGLALATALLDPVLPGVAASLAWVNGWLAAYLAWCARLVAALPWAQVESWQALVGLAGVVAFLAVALRLRPPRGLRVTALAVLVVFVAVAWRPGSAPGPPPPSGLRLTFLDVGQGDGCLIQTPQAAVLVDEGPPEADVAQQLRRLGLRRLTAIVLTHPQRDHVGGAAAVLEQLRVRFVLDPRIPSASSDERAALAAARHRHVPVVLARAGRAYAVGPLRLRILWPDDPGPPGEDPNQHAVVLLVSYGRVDALLTADAESDVTLPIDPPPAEILKVAHHGSADEGLPELLERVHPEVAVISVGAHNDYGHPAPSTLTTLRQTPGLRLYRTDEDGRVVVESDGRRIWVRSER
jgi:competence protein ComEC